MGIQLGQESKLFLPCLVTGLQQKRVAAGSLNKDDFSLAGSCWRHQKLSELSPVPAAEGSADFHVHLKSHS